MNIERDAMARSDSPPYGERVVDDVGRGSSDLRRIAQVSNVALAVVLHKVGLYFREKILDHFVRDIAPESGIARVGMQIKVNAEKGFAPARARRGAFRGQQDGRHGKQEAPACQFQHAVILSQPDQA